jgi:hypothetical protein
VDVEARVEDNADAPPLAPFTEQFCKIADVRKELNRAYRAARKANRAEASAVMAAGLAGLRVLSAIRAEALAARDFWRAKRPGWIDWDKRK